MTMSLTNTVRRPRGFALRTRLVALWASSRRALRLQREYRYMEELPARREAMRGTFDPGYLNYTLGKLMILKMRDDYRKEQGSAYSLKGFHDGLLSYGAPPLPLLRGVMLKSGTSSPL